MLLNQMVLNLNKTLVCDHSYDLAISQYFHEALLIMFYKLVVTFQSVNKTLVCDHSNENFRVALLIMLHTADRTFRSVDDYLIKRIKQYFNFVCKILIPGEQLHYSPDI